MNSAEEYTRHQKEQANLAVDMLRMLRLASRKIGRPPMALVREYWRLSRGPGRLNVYEYFNFQLYDDERFSPEEKARFLSGSVHWRITDLCSDLSWRAATEDKWLASRILEACGLTVPQTVAVIEPGPRVFGDVPKISSAAELGAFLHGCDAFPLFAKPNRELGSFGACRITGIEGERIQLDQLAPVSCREWLDETVAGRTYLLQRHVENHPVIRKFSRSVATVRTVNLVKEDGVVSVPFTLLKIPVGDNIADNYWREGNLLADIDPESGILRRVVRGKGPEMEEFEVHPDGGTPLVGFQLPCWKELRQVNERCARLFAPVRYQSLDIALTPEGPCVVEINSGGSFELPQLAAATGFLTAEVREFFTNCGYSFRRG